jgi:hypothetical protein
VVIGWPMMDVGGVLGVQVKRVQMTLIFRGCCAGVL